MFNILYVYVTSEVEEKLQMRGVSKKPLKVYTRGKKGANPASRGHSGQAPDLTMCDWVLGGRSVPDLGESSVAWRPRGEARAWSRAAGPTSSVDEEVQPGEGPVKPPRGGSG